MNRGEIRIRNIKILRNFERRILKYGNGVIIGEGNRRLFYNKITGTVSLAYKNKRGYWKEQKGSSGRYKNGYLMRKIPGTNIHVYCHVVAAVALGMYDNDKNLDLIVNHKNYNKDDNRPNNIELCTYSENKYHSELIETLKEFGLWKKGMTFDARFAKYVIKEAKGDFHALENMVRGYSWINELDFKIAEDSVERERFNDRT